LGRRKSLLLVGVTGTTGKFRAGDVVEIGATAKGIVDCSSNELNAFLKHREKKQPQQRKVIVHADNLVLIE
jgi:glutamate 5-kinase